MNQTSDSIREQNVNLARFDDCRYLSCAERRMHHGFSAAIDVRSIVWCADFHRRPTREALLVGNT